MEKPHGPGSAGHSWRQMLRPDGDLPSMAARRSGSSCEVLLGVRTERCGMEASPEVLNFGSEGIRRMKKAEIRKCWRGIKFIVSISPSHNTVLRIILQVLRPCIRKQAESAGDGGI